jgi:hypothetical protein
MLTHGSRRALRCVHARRAFTLAEVLFSLALGALVLGLAVSVGARLQHRLLGESARLTASEQLASAAELLPLDLRGASPSTGDIVEARDTALQLRTTIGTAIVCGGSATSLLLASYLGPGARALTLGATTGDTLWLLVDSDSIEQWRPARIASTRGVAGSCPALGAGAQLFDVGHLWAVDLRDSAAVTPGTFVRMTRPMRYSFYRAGDGRWYLGVHSWNAAAAQFNLVQPLAGPYASPLQGRTGFRYFDERGSALAFVPVDARRIARVEAELQGEAPPASSRQVADTLRVVVAARNR